MNIAFLAAAAMVVQDTLGVCMVQAEARNRGWLAGILDSAMWLFAIVTTSVSVTALQGHDTAEKVLVVGLVTVANLGGSKLGQIIGSRYISPEPHPLNKAVDDLARRVQILEEGTTCGPR